ncbi:ArsR/SmtB family transcription factor [Methylocystis bryophila]|uniref:Transcriptional regulator n=1 Tax=Methylocystis bryophila TaxID=655015 RepID=A0A1W6MX66_9HYPH|nr:metalloregulator ArsR/SmtB family transcription factor [Methylocystis bryophila]ARN82136.1 transcriptional regulator [Methylocystis bryophila]BDV38266.1 transcriptional regulator [Methylocystis bryophila]
MLNEQALLDLVFHALADPTRRAIVERLTRGPASVSELAAPMSMSLAAVMQHLHVLEESRLLRTEKQGRVRTCSIDPEALKGAEAWLTDRRKLWENRLDLLGEMLAADTLTSKSPQRSKL